MSRIGDPDETTRGSVGSANGAPLDVLTVDGSNGGPARQVFRAPGEPFTILLAAPPGTANPIFAIWGSVGPRNPMRRIRTRVGSMALLPHFLDPTSTELFTLVNTVPDPLSLLNAAPGSWVFNSPGLPVPITFNLQGIIQDAGAERFGFSVFNALTFTIE